MNKLIIYKESQIKQIFIDIESNFDIKKQMQIDIKKKQVYLQYDEFSSFINARTSNTLQSNKCKSI